MKILGFKFSWATIAILAFAIYNIVLAYFEYIQPFLVWVYIIALVAFVYSFYNDNKPRKPISHKIGLLILLILPLPMFAQNADIPVEADQYDTLLLILSGVGGILIHVLMKVRDRFSKTKEKLTWVKFKSEPDWGNHILNSGIAFLVVIALAFMKDSMWHILPLTYATMAGIAYQADSIWKNVTNFKERDINERTSS